MDWSRGSWSGNLCTYLQHLLSPTTMISRSGICGQLRRVSSCSPLRVHRCLDVVGFLCCTETATKVRHRHQGRQSAHHTRAWRQINKKAANGHCQPIKQALTASSGFRSKIDPGDELQDFLRQHHPARKRHSRPTRTPRATAPPAADAARGTPSSQGTRDHKEVGNRMDGYMWPSKHDDCGRSGRVAGGGK